VEDKDIVNDVLAIKGIEFNSRLCVGAGKYKDTRATIMKRSGAMI